MERFRPIWYLRIAAAAILLANFGCRPIDPIPVTPKHQSQKIVYEGIEDPAIFIDRYWAGRLPELESIKAFQRDYLQQKTTFISQEGKVDLRSGTSKYRWLRFKSQYQEGDELWLWADEVTIVLTMHRTQITTWAQGLCLIRKNEVIALHFDGTGTIW